MGEIYINFEKEKLNYLPLQTGRNSASEFHTLFLKNEKLMPKQNGNKKN